MTDSRFEAFFNMFLDAYTEAIQIRREQARINPEEFLPAVASTLGNLGNLYSNLRRLQDAEEAYAESLKTYRELAQVNPKTYLPKVALTLNNMGIFFKAEHHDAEATQVCLEAGAIFNQLAISNPDQYGAAPNNVCVR